MTWARMDDAMGEHRKTRRLLKAGGLDAFGLHSLAILNCARYLTDGFVEEEFVEETLDAAKVRGKARDKITDKLEEIGQWIACPGGWMIHDYLDHNPSKTDVEHNRAWERKRKELSRDVELVDAIRKRDQDRCRYCGVKVDWKDRRSKKAATYDHIIPRGDNTLGNVVVACRSCNFKKGSRTPDEAGMPLLPPGGFGATPADGSDPGQTKGQPKPSQPPVPALPDPALPVPSLSEPSRPDVDKVCDLLADLIRSNDPKAKVDPDGKRWRDAARLLIDNDRRTVDEIEQVIRWCQADQFWQSNVLSMPKLREKFQQLALRMRTEQLPSRQSAGPSAEDFLAAGGGTP